MTLCLAVSAFVVAAATAVRSTWSPCGLSMLSTITPFGERAKGHSYRATAAWFVFGAVAVLKPALLSAMIGIAAAAAISFVRPWGALLIVAAILYSRGWLHPRQVRWPNFVGIAGRLALALLYLTLGGGFIWLALFEGLFGVLLAWTYSRLLVAELLTRP